MLCKAAGRRVPLVRIHTRTSVCISFGSDKAAENYKTDTNERSLTGRRSSYRLSRRSRPIAVENVGRSPDAKAAARLEVRREFRPAQEPGYGQQSSRQKGRSGRAVQWA